jgi:hypothetical protein
LHEPEPQDVFKRKNACKAPLKGVEEPSVVGVEAGDTIEHDDDDTGYNADNQRDIEGTTGLGLGFEDDVMECLLHVGIIRGLLDT